MTLAPALRKGANTPVPTGTLRVVVSWAPSRVVDVCAVLVTELDRVRSDDDFVFYNAPAHPSGAVALSVAAPDTAGLVVTLPRVAPEVARIVVAGSLDEGTFPELADLCVVLSGEAGRPVTRFLPEPDEPVTALVFGELYRRAGGWRFRAVGQGWDSGLAGLARGFGIRVQSGEDGPREDAPRESGPREDDPAAGCAVPARSPAQRPSTDGPPPAVPGRSPVRRLSTDGPPPAVPGRSPVQRPSADGPSDATEGDGPGGPPLPASGDPARAPRRIRADWYRDPVRPDHMRWWDGQRWQGGPMPIRLESDSTCGRCGAGKRWRLFGGPPVCEACTEEIRSFLRDWRARFSSALTEGDPTGADLEPLWAELRYQRIPESAGWEIVQSAGLAHLERLTAFAFADGVVEADEVDRIETAARRLRLAGPGVDALRGRLARGLELSRIGAGELPRLPAGGLHLELDEILHLDVPATLVRPAAAGPRQTPGRLIGTNRKLRFLGETGRGTELGLSKIVEVEVRGGAVDIAATTSRGSGGYLVDDPEYVAAVLAGVLRVARRQVIAPGSRASRVIPQAVKAEVWRRDGGVCVECGGGEHLEFDHVIPFSRGGASSVNNLQLLCRRCNRAKGARI
jgi:stress response protein SCP2